RLKTEDTTPELDSDAETPFRAPEKGTNSGNPAPRSGGSGKKSMSPTDRFKSFVAWGFAKGDEEGQGRYQDPAANQTTADASPPKSSLRKSLLARATSWASPQARNRTDEWLEVLKPSPILSGETVSPQIGSEAKPEATAKDASRVTRRKGTSKAGSRAAKKQRKQNQQGSPGDVSPRMPPSGFCGIRSRARCSGRAALAVKPRSVLRPLTPQSATKANTDCKVDPVTEHRVPLSADDRKLMRSHSVANIDELGAELQRMQAELRKSNSGLCIDRRGRPLGSPAAGALTSENNPGAKGQGGSVIGKLDIPGKRTPSAKATATGSKANTHPARHGLGTGQGRGADAPHGAAGQANVSAAQEVKLQARDA
ncbi:uncharacterized protein LOC142358534, partial [Convolutriloba macropyga]|uniref:uncharacterized protein LOC142358534 n=1 Tax=Convolutriloba macropyga TaxID=536237 RepID=UPI003F523267